MTTNRIVLIPLQDGSELTPVTGEIILDKETGHVSTKSTTGEIVSKTKELERSFDDENINYNTSFEITHNMDSYPNTNVLMINGYGFGPYGVFAISSAIQLKHAIEYVDENTIRLYVNEDFNDEEYTVTNVTGNEYSITFDNLEVELLFTLV